VNNTTEKRICSPYYSNKFVTGQKKNEAMQSIFKPVTVIPTFSSEKENDYLFKRNFQVIMNLLG